MIRPCPPDEAEAILAVINDAARAYRGVIPDDCWKEPYMSRAELERELAAGVRFRAWQEADELVGVMGIQPVRDVTLIRHAYVRSRDRGRGIGGLLLDALRSDVGTPLLVGTWAAADWAIRFYEKHGFRLVPADEKERLLRRYWTVPARQREVSVVLVGPRWREGGGGGKDQEIPTGFGDVDHLTRPAECIRYLDEIAVSPAFGPYKERVLQLLGAAAGERVLEVGCGTGANVQRLGEAVGASGLIVGIDRSRTLASVARERTEPAARTACSVADAHALPFPVGVFDACLADRVLMHVAAPERALREMARVTRARGRLVAAEPDWETLVIDATDQALTRRVRDVLCDTTPHGWMGRRLRGLFLAEGLEDVVVTAASVILTDGPAAIRHFDVERALLRLQRSGETAPEDAADWLEALRRPDRPFFAALTIFIARGRKNG